MLRLRFHRLHVTHIRPVIADQTRPVLQLIDLMIKTGVEVCGLRNLSDLQTLEDREIALEAEKIVALVATFIPETNTSRTANSPDVSAPLAAKLHLVADDGARQARAEVTAADAHSERVRQ